MTRDSGLSGMMVGFGKMYTFNSRRRRLEDDRSNWSRYGVAHKEAKLVQQAVERRLEVGLSCLDPLAAVSHQRPAGASECHGRLACAPTKLAFDLACGYDPRAELRRRIERGYQELMRNSGSGTARRRAAVPDPTNLRCWRRVPPLPAGMLSACRSSVDAPFAAVASMRASESLCSSLAVTIRRLVARPRPLCRPLRSNPGSFCLRQELVP